MPVASFVRWFADVSLADVGLVGGKNASLGELYRELKPSPLTVTGISWTRTNSLGGSAIS
jgi:phosphoenolpyruvate synthase/pyruvate phosphate dikinase